MRIYISVVTIFLLIMMSSISAGEKTMKEPNNFSLADLNWIAGNWEGEGLGGICEEHWTSPKGNSMTGVFKLSSGEKTQVIEFLIIEQTDEGIFYQFKHYGTDMIPWETEPLEFKLIEYDDFSAKFESTKQVEGKPKMLIYNHTDKGDLSVRVIGWAHTDEKPDYFDVVMSPAK